MFGPIEERRHDDFMLGMSDLLPKLHGFVQPNGQPYSTYGDPAYPITCNILAPLWGFNLTIHEQEFNRKMSKVRVNVEWGLERYARILLTWSLKENLKVLIQSVGKYYLVATILINCYTCLYRSQTSSFLELEPPKLQTYLSNQRTGRPWNITFFYFGYKMLHSS